MLTEPACVISIGLDKDLLPDEQGQEQVTAISVTSAGTAHAILVWWELDLWQGQRRDEESITYSMDPRDPNVPFQDHWQHCLHVLPEALRLSCGDVALLRACHDDSSIQVQFLPTTTMASPHDEGIPGGRASKRPRYASVPLEPNSLSPLRTLQLTDPARLKFFRTAIQDASSSLAQTITGGLNHLHVLDISDFGWCGILAGVQGCRVTSLECSPGNVQAEMTSRVAQASRLPEDCRFDVLACHTEQLNREILGGVPDIVIAEPFYQVLEGWHLQEALNFWYTVRSLRRKAVLSSDTVVIPSACRIMACGIESQQLRASYAPCGDDQSSNVCGFDHRALNRCCCISETTLTLPLWQYNYRRLTAKIEVGYLDYTAPQDDGIRLSSTATVAEIGRLDALVIWLDYLYETRGREGERVLNLPTDSRSFLQGVRMLKTPVALSKDDVCRTSVEVDLALGDLNGSDDHTIAVHLIREDCS
jgi:protein arginine N-methyltransferase 7